MSRDSGVQKQSDENWVRVGKNVENKNRHKNLIGGTRRSISCAGCNLILEMHFM